MVYNPLSTFYARRAIDQRGMFGAQWEQMASNFDLFKENTMPKRDDGSREISEILPHGIGKRCYPYYVVVYRRRFFLLRPFLGTYVYSVMGITHKYQADRRIKGWEGTTSGLFIDPNEASNLAMKSWAIHHHPLRVLIFGLFNPSLIRYRREWERRGGVGFWDR